MLYLIFLFHTLALTPSASADDILLDAITVQGSRLSNERRSVQVITETEIEKSNAVYVGDLLKRTSGVDWVGNGFAYVRGGTGSQTLVFIDGVRVNDPSDPSRAYDFSSLDLSQVERIEVFKGPQSVSFGSDAMAGVISITTKKATESHRKVQASYGSHRTARTSARLAMPLIKDRLGLSIRAARQNSEGPSAAFTPNGDLDRKQLSTAGVNLFYTPDAKTEIQTAGEITYLKQDLDRGSFTDDPNLKSRNLQHTLYTKIQRQWGDQAQTGLLVSRKKIRRAFDDRPEAGNPFLPQDSTYFGTLTDVDFNHRIFFNSDHELVMGAEWKKEKIAIESFLSPTPLARDHLNTVGAYAQDRLNLGSGWTWEAGLRHERPSQFGSSTQKKLGLEKSFGDTTKITSAFGTGFKVPSLYSLYDSFFGNPRLRIEKSRAFEAGIEHTIANENIVRLTGFVTRYEDLISFNFATNRSENIAEAQVRGVEFDAQWLKSRKTSFQTHTTYLHALDRQTGQNLPRRARWKAGTVIDREFSEAWHMQMEGLIKSSAADSATQTVRAPMFTLLHLSGDYRLNETFKVTGRLENVFDRKYFEVLGYSTLGRSFFAGLEARF